jgi:SAM-dependent methyltransferase
VSHTIAVDLGSGATPRNHFGATKVFGVDVVPQGEDVIVCDLAVSPIPIKDGIIDFVTAFDFLEHIPRVVYHSGQRKNSFVDVMNEVWRILKPGGLFYSFTPAFPKLAAFSDPTHVNIITEETFIHYFDDRHRKATIYGFNGAFQVIEQTWKINHLATLMRKV